MRTRPHRRTGSFHTFDRVSELPDEIDNDLGDTQLLNELLFVMNDLGGATKPWAALTKGVGDAADRLRQLEVGDSSA